MTNIQKKLEDWEIQTTNPRRIGNKVNEIIGYLQAKEEASKAQARAAKHIENNQHEYDEIRDKCFCGREKKNVYHIEASKGECKICGGKYGDHGYINGTPCPKLDDPLESKGECDHKVEVNIAGLPQDKKLCWVCPKCGEVVEGKVNPPEHEDECESGCLCRCHKLSDEDRRLHMCVCPKSNPPEHEDTELGKLEKDYIDSFGEVFRTWSSYGWWIKYIRSNYVSKEKIKRAFTKILGHSIGCVDFNDKKTCSNCKLSKSLGLGD